MSKLSTTNVGTARRAQRWRLLLRLDRWLEPTMVLLGLVWLLLMVVEFVWTLKPWLQVASNVIWVIFICEFILRLSVAPKKLVFLKSNWLTVIALLLPAFRILRFARALRLFRATRGLRLVRLLTSLNRGGRSLGRAMNKKGAGYVAALTIAVTVGGAAGMFVFERTASGAEFDSFAEALWWTAMIVTTMGSDYWPHTAEGRVLTLLLSIYAVGVFGYLAATLASYFVQHETDQNRKKNESDQFATLQESVQKLTEEIRELRENHTKNLK